VQLFGEVAAACAPGLESLNLSYCRRLSTPSFAALASGFPALRVLQLNGGRGHRLTAEQLRLLGGAPWAASLERLELAAPHYEPHAAQLRELLLGPKPADAAAATAAQRQQRGGDRIGPQGMLLLRALNLPPSSPLPSPPQLPASYRGMTGLRMLSLAAAKLTSEEWRDLLCALLLPRRSSSGGAGGDSGDHACGPRALQLLELLEPVGLDDSVLEGLVLELQAAAAVNGGREAAAPPFLRILRPTFDVTPARWTGVAGLEVLP
jgi:hypothetical protein